MAVALAIDTVGLMTRDKSNYQLQYPPVTSVSLRIGFRALPGLQNWMLAPFVSKMRGEASVVEETEPLAPLEDYPLAPADPALGKAEEAPSGLHALSWPVPRTRFHNNDRVIAIQGDELEVKWVFDADNAEKYPGFDELRRQMKRFYRSLIEAVGGHGVAINPSLVECMYTNSIPEVTAGTLAVGVLTNWSGEGVVPESSAGYVGVRLHNFADPGKHDCASLVMVDSRGNDESPVLSFRVIRRVEKGADAIGSLTKAHKEVIALFKRHTSDDLRRGWGER